MQSRQYVANLSCIALNFPSTKRSMQGVQEIRPQEQHFLATCRLMRKTSPSPSAVAQHTVQAPPSTKGLVSYVRAPPGGQDLFRYLYNSQPEGTPVTNLERQDEEVTVHNLRTLPNNTAPNLQENGLQLCKFQVPDDIDWTNEKEIEAKYYPLVEKLLKDVTGASRVHIFDNTVRKGQVKERHEGSTFDVESYGQPVDMVHVDYTAKGGPRRLASLLPDESDKLQQTPFAVIQVWRPLKGPVQSSPLGIIDAATVEKDDLINYRLHFPDRVGYNYGVAHNPKHKWYYVEGMKNDEAYVFVCYHSRTDRARFTPHTGFRDLNSGPNADARESIEVRSCCFWEEEPPQLPYLEL